MLVRYWNDAVPILQTQKFSSWFYISYICEKRVWPWKMGCCYSKDQLWSIVSSFKVVM